MGKDQVQAIKWDGEKLSLLDQRALPFRVEYLDIDGARSAAQAIRDMVVRGAPAIGITAAYAIVLAARRRVAEDGVDWQDGFEKDLELLAAARPTAVNLRWAVERMRGVAQHSQVHELAKALTAAAESIHADDVSANHRMGELGAVRIAAGSGVMRVKHGPGCRAPGSPPGNSCRTVYRCNWSLIRRRRT